MILSFSNQTFSKKTFKTKFDEIRFYLKVRKKRNQKLNDGNEISISK